MRRAFASCGKQIPKGRKENKVLLWGKSLPGSLSPGCPPLLLHSRIMGTCPGLQPSHAMSTVRTKLPDPIQSELYILHQKSGFLHVSSD